MSGCVPGCESHGGGLCYPCENLIDSSALLTGTFWVLTRPVENYLHYTARGLENSARSCRLCQFLLRSIQQRSTSQYGLLSDASPNSSMEKFTVKVWYEKPFQRRSILRIQIFGDGINNSIPLIVKEVRKDVESYGCDVLYRTDSPMIMNLIKRWIQTCHSHTLCRKDFIPEDQRTFRPTRLLDVGQNGSPNICLVVVPDHPPSASFQYVALSHCWGKYQNMPRLLTERLPSMTQSISVAGLPKNFRDAVSIARRIGAQYLWIDSLCIVQDDDDEWIRESTNMGLVYANALCVISATASENPEGGCSFQRLASTNDCVLRRYGDISLVVRSRVHGEEGLANLFWEKVEQAVLATRAWTFQERILATRVLHFCDGVVLFECNTLRASEYHEDGLPYSRKVNVRLDGTLHPSSFIRRLYVPDEQHIQTQEQVFVPGAETVRRARGRPTRFLLPDQTVQRTVTRPNSTYESQEAKLAALLQISAQSGMRGAFELLLRFRGTKLTEKVEFHQCWYELVEQYSSRNLTKPTDKVVAIAGVACFIQQSTGLQFAAGLWKGILPFNLLWTHPEPPNDPRPRRPVPTWSWASVDGKVSHRLKVSFQSPDPVEPLPFSLPSPTSISEVRTTWGHIEPLISDECVETILEKNDLILHAAVTLSGHLCNLDCSTVDVIPDVVFDHSAKELAYLPILSFKNTRVHPLGSPLQVHGLVLQSVGGVSPTYERVGYFWTANQTVATEILHGLGERCSIRLV